MNHYCSGETAAPYTFAGLDELDKMDVTIRLNRRRRERLLAREASQTTPTKLRIEAHSESDELHAEGEQNG